MSNMISPEVTASYCNVLTPRAFSATADPKYSLLCVLDPEIEAHKKFITKLESEITNVMKAKFGETKNSKIP